MIESASRMAAAKAASKTASEATNGDSSNGRTEMAVVDKGDGVVEMVPSDEDAEVGKGRINKSGPLLANS